MEQKKYWVYTTSVVTTGKRGSLETPVRGVVVNESRSSLLAGQDDGGSKSPGHWRSVQRVPDQELRHWVKMHPFWVNMPRGATIEIQRCAPRIQTRKSISLRGVTYQRVREHCKAQGISISSFVEGLLAEKLPSATRN